jgi:hypothetical protein
VDADDDIDAKVKAEGLMEEEASDMDDDDELEEEPSARDSPKAEPSGSSHSPSTNSNLKVWIS